MKLLIKSLDKNLRSFSHAWRGLLFVFRTENNIWYHTVAAILVVLCGWFFQVSITEWMVIGLLCGLVFMAELFNTALEKLLDFVSPQHHHQVGLIKDIAAGAVLIISLTALLMGLLIFIPKILFHLNLYYP